MASKEVPKFFYCIWAREFSQAKCYVFGLIFESFNCPPSFDIYESFCLRYYMSCVFIDIYMYMYGHKFCYHFKGKAVFLRKALFCWRKAVSICDGLLAVFDEMLKFAVFELFHLLWIVFFNLHENFGFWYFTLCTWCSKNIQVQFVWLSAEFQVLLLMLRQVHV